MAPAGCHSHRHASRDSYYKNMINLIHHISFITFFLAISHHIAYPAKTSYRQLAGAIWLSLYCMKCKRPVIALLYH